jgi:hypothetical protein
MQTGIHDEYTEKIRASMAAAYRFFERHKQPRTTADWDCIGISLGAYRDSFTQDLIICVVDELEREYTHEMGRGESVP